MNQMPDFSPLVSTPCAGLELAPVRIACIGMGRRGRKHINVLRACPLVEFVGSVDAAVCAAGQTDGTPVWPDLEGLLKAARPSAVIAAVPHDQYLPVLSACAEYGVHVLAEKPIGRNLREVEEIIQVVRAHSIHVAVAAQRRQTRFYSALEQEILLHGPPMTFWYHYALGLQTVATAWRASAEAAGGGATIDMGYHVLDIFSGLLGRPNRLSCLYYADGAHPVSGLEHGASVLLQFGASTGTASFDWYQTHEEEQAAFWWRGHGIVLRDGAVFRVTREAEQLICPKEDSLEIMHRQLHEFLRALAGEDSRCCSLEATLETHRLIERCGRGDVVAA